MFISEFLGDANFSLVLFTMFGYLTVNYINRIDRFTISDRQAESVWGSLTITFLSRGFF